MQAIQILPLKMALVQFAPGSEYACTEAGEFFAFIRTPEERSYVIEERFIPPAASQVSTGWRLLEVKGPFPLDAIGVLASIATPLAAAKVSIFALSTYNTDYLLIQQQQLPHALQALREAGHSVIDLQYIDP